MACPGPLGAAKVKGLPPMTPNRSLALKVLVVTAIYAVLGQLSVYPAITGSINMEAIWLPSGFLFAVLMRSPRRQWAVLMGAVVLAGLAVNFYQMRAFVPSFVFRRLMRRALRRPSPTRVSR